MITVNGVEEVHHDETLAALLARHGIEPRGVAVAIDGDVVPRSKWATTSVEDQRHVEIVTAAAGG